MAAAAAAAAAAAPIVTTLHHVNLSIYCLCPIPSAGRNEGI